MVTTNFLRQVCVQAGSNSSVMVVEELRVVSVEKRVTSPKAFTPDRISRVTHSHGGLTSGNPAVNMKPGRQSTVRTMNARP